MKKGLLFSLHSIAGLLSGLFILLMSLSGALLVFDNELDSFQRPSARPVTSDIFISTDKAFMLVKQQYPQAQVSNCRLPVPNDPFFRFTIFDTAHKNAASPLQVFISGTKEELVNVRDAKAFNSSFMNWLSGFHSSFHLGKKGEWLLGVFGLVFLLSLVTGFILFRKNIIAVITFRRSVYRLTNLHQLAGVYALLFNLVIAVTGVWMQRYVFKKEFYAGNSWVNTVKSTPVPGYSIDSACRALQQVHPDFTPAIVYFPQKVNGGATVYGSRAGNSFIHSKDLADYIGLDSMGGIAYTGFVTDIKAADRYDIIIAQVHFGRYGGWPVKLLYTLFGLSGALLSITGFVIWLKRKKRS